MAVKSMSKANAMQAYIQLAESNGLVANGSNNNGDADDNATKPASSSSTVGGVISRLALTDDDVDAAATAERKRDLCFFVSLGDIDEVHAKKTKQRSCDCTF
jgi:hypothetical protein